MVKKRQSNIELLRIISMLLIVAHHFSVHGGFKFSESSITINRLWMQFFQMGGKIGVNVFVLISGYFLIASSKLKISKVLKLWFQLFFYSVVIYFIFTFFGNEVLSIKTLIKSCLPVIYTNWWFASTYFLLYLVSPYLNQLLNSFTKKEYQNFLVLLTFLWCIIPTLTHRTIQSNPLIWFIYLYAFAGYIRVYGFFNDLKTKSCMLVAIFVSILTYLSAVIFDFLGLKMVFFSKNATYFFDMQCVPILIIAVFLFLGFLRLEIKSIKIINVISSATFGVYLLHDNSYIRPFLWKALFKNASYTYKSSLIPYSIVVVALVYIGCTIIELLRIHVVERKYVLYLNRMSEKLGIFIDKIQKLISTRI